VVDENLNIISSSIKYIPGSEDVLNAGN